MMGIGVPETCWAYKKYNKITSDIYLIFVLQLWKYSNDFISSYELMILCRQTCDIHDQFD